MQKHQSFQKISAKLKPGQNKKGLKIFQLHGFLNTFLQLTAEKKYSKDGAARNFFGPSYFVTALGHSTDSHWRDSHSTDCHWTNGYSTHHHLTQSLDRRLFNGRSFNLRLLDGRSFKRQSFDTRSTDRQTDGRI